MIDASYSYKPKLEINIFYQKFNFLFLMDLISYDLSNEQDLKKVGKSLLLFCVLNFYSLP